ncbi:hypothetical protein ACKKBF_B34220 [Auxenochlorella protothecoides x Auxenochlorella symbiontica]
MRAVILFWALLILLCQSGALASQGNIYQGLWGGLFAKQARANRTGLFSSLQSAVEGWRESASEVQASLAAHLNDRDGRKRSEGLFWPLNATLGLVQGDEAAGPQAEPRAGLDSLYHHVASDLARLDPKVLAAAAALQGWALASLLKKKEGVTSGLQRLRYPLPLPDPQWPAFDPALCLRLQNFGGGEGYRSVYFAQAACDPDTSLSAEGLLWGGAAAFGLDCTLHGSEGEGGEGAGSPPAPEQTWLGSVVSSLHHTRACTLAVATEAGEGSMLTQSAPLPALGGPEINAMSLRLCNTALGRGGEGAQPAVAADFLLRRLKLNGRPLLPPEGMPAPSVPLAAGCASQLYHVSPRALSAGFSLDGALELGSGPPVPGTGVGAHASLEIALGNYGLVSAAASYLRGGGGAGAKGVPSADTAL